MPVISFRYSYMLLPSPWLHITSPLLGIYILQWHELCSGSTEINENICTFTSQEYGVIISLPVLSIPDYKINHSGKKDGNILSVHCVLLSYCLQVPALSYILIALLILKKQRF